MKFSLLKFGVFCFLILHVVPQISAQNKPQGIEEILFDIKTVKIDTLKVSGYLNAYKYYNSNNQLDSAIFYLEKAASESEKSKTKYKLGNIYNSLGIAFRSNEEYHKSIIAYDKSIQIYHKIKNPNEYKTRINKAILHIMKSEYSKATEELMICLDYYEKTNNNNGLGEVYKQIARIHTYTLDNQNALKYFFKAKNILEREKNFFSLSAALEGIGSTYMNLEQFELAIEYHQKQLEIAKDHKLPSHSATALNNIGLCYFELKNYKKALDYYYKSLEIRLVLNEKQGLISSYQKLCDTYLVLKQLDKALEYQKMALNLVESSSKNPRILLESYKTLYEINERNGNDKDAFKYYKSFVSIRDSIEGKKQILEVEKIKALFEAEKKQSQILSLSSKLKLQEFEKQKQEHLNELLETEKSNIELNNQLLTNEKKVRTLEINTQRKELETQNESLKVKDLALKQERTIKWLLLGLMVLFGSLMAFVYWIYQKEKKIKIGLQIAKEEIEVKNQQLDALNKTKDKLFSIISHDLKSPVSDLHYFIKPFFKKQGDNEEVEKINKKLEDLNSTMDNLLIWALQQSNGLKIELKSENITDLINAVIQAYKSQLAYKNITLLFSNAPFFAIVDERKLEIVLRNILSNAIKFTNEGGYIKIDTRLNENNFEIEVKDTGDGMTEEELKKALQGLTSKNGTNGEKGTGLGLMICKEFIGLHGGTFEMRSIKEKGTTVILKIPFKI